MKIKDLLNIEKVIEVKNIELEEKKQELARLRQEAEKLKFMIDLNNKDYRDDELIDINNIYLIKKKKSDVVCFANKIEIAFLKYRFVDIYTNENIAYLSNFELLDALEGNNILYFCKAIREAFPEIRVYPDGKVPKLLIQKLYYQANGVDNKVLKRGIITD